MPAVSTPPPFQGARLASVRYRGADGTRQLPGSRRESEFVGALGPCRHVQRNRLHIADQILDDLGQLEGGQLNAEQAVGRARRMFHGRRRVRQGPEQ